jgi:ClpP class serine protease
MDLIELEKRSREAKERQSQEQNERFQALEQSLEEKLNDKLNTMQNAIKRLNKNQKILINKVKKLEEKTKKKTLLQKILRR